LLKSWQNVRVAPNNLSFLPAEVNMLFLLSVLYANLGNCKDPDPDPHDKVPADIQSTGVVDWEFMGKI